MRIQVLPQKQALWTQPFPNPARRQIMFQVSGELRYRISFSYTNEFDLENEPCELDFLQTRQDTKLFDFSSFDPSGKRQENINILQ